MSVILSGTTYVKHSIRTKAGLEVGTNATVGGTLGVTGDLTTSGANFLNGATTYLSSTIMGSGASLSTDVGAYGGILLRNTSQTIDAPTLITGTTGNYWLFCENGDKAFDFSHAQQTNPTIFLHSANQATDEWISLAHDQTDAVINSGKGAVTLVNGVLRFAETTTPTARTNYGAIYTKSDNIPYFQDGDGDEKIISTAPTDYGEMGNTEDATEALVSDDEWHALYHTNINGSSPHLSSGFTFVEGKSGGGNVTTAQAGAAININDADHGLLDNDIITVQSANHVGVGTVTYVDVDNFEVDITYVGDEAATWQMGSYLLVATSGIYRGAWNASFSQSLNNTQTSIISPFVNTTQATKAQASRLLANNTDVGSIGGNGIMSFSAGDRIWFAAQTSAAQTLTFTIRNVSIH